MAGRVRQAWSFFGGWCHWGEKRSSGVRRNIEC